jgi:hypothetical protein
MPASANAAPLLVAGPPRSRAPLPIEPWRRLEPLRRSLDGTLVPIDSLVKMEPRAGPQAINHYGQLTAVTIAFNIRLRHLARRRGPEDRADGRQDPPDEREPGLPGHGRRLPAIGQEPAASEPC